jgi:protease-4
MAAPAASRVGRGWKVLAIVLLVLLALSSLSNLRHWFGEIAGLSARGGGHPSLRLEEVVMEEADTDDKIAVVDLQGIIYGGVIEAGGHNPVALVERQLKRAGEDKDVRSVIVRVNSPGGEVLAADEIYKTIDEFQRKTGKPVVASMGSLAASGGYYVSAPCQWIVANELTITGSIGVIMHGYNYRGLMGKIGLRPEVYKSGKFKDMLSGEKLDEEILPEERQMVQALINQTYGRFKNVVSEGRQQANQRNQGGGRKLAANWEEFADGRILSGQQAYELGMVDELGNFRTAVARAKQLSRVPKANLIQYVQPFDLSNLFRLFGQSESRTVKVDLGVDWPRLQVGHLYFLFLPGAR